MRRIKFGILVLVIALLLVPTAFIRAAGEGSDETFKACLRLLSGATIVERSGMYHAYLRALRHLRDPQLEPLYRYLMKSKEPGLKVHGFLGLCECQGGKKLDLEYLAEVKDPALQAEMVSAAMDAELVDTATARQVLAWPDLDLGAKLVVAGQLVKAKQTVDHALLLKAAAGPNLARRGLAALLLLQLGDPQAEGLMHEVDNSTDPGRDDVREMMLETAMRYELDRAGPWAMRIARSLGSDSRLGAMALRVALRFGAPEAGDFWRRQLASEDDVAGRNRLALLALNVSPWAKATLFDPLVASKEVLFQRIGRAGQAVANKKDVAPALVALIDLHYPLASEWCLGYADLYASDPDAQVVLMALVRGYQAGLPSATADLDHVVSATEFLYQKDPKAAVKLLGPILADRQTDLDMARGILLGLLRCRGAGAYEVVRGLGTLGNPNADGLVLLLLAKSGAPMNAQQMSDLSLLVRGGVDIPDVLRLQAAWLYLKHSGQAQAALEQVME